MRLVTKGKEGNMLAVYIRSFSTFLKNKNIKYKITIVISIINHSFSFQLRIGNLRKQVRKKKHNCVKITIQSTRPNWLLTTFYSI